MPGWARQIQWRSPIPPKNSSARSSASNASARPLTLLGRAPSLADCARARLADIEPPPDIYCPEVELEQRVIRDRLDHAANAASRHPTANQSPDGRVVRHLRPDRADAELVIIVA